MTLRMLLPLALLLASAAQAQTTTVYQYGMPLDVARVVQLDEPATEVCDVVKAYMTYVDSAGRQHTVQYLKLAKVCTDRG